MDTNFIRAKAFAANERIHLALAQIDVGDEASQTGAPSAAALDLCILRLGEASSDIDALLAELAPADQASPAVRACPACGKSIRAQATRCGFCWTKQ